MEYNYDVIVIGSGPGGYVSAIKAGKLGLKTAIIEGEHIGGTCLNKGCIPTKTLLHSSHLYNKMLKMEHLGISATNVTYDYNKIMDRKESIVDSIKGGIKQLLKGNGVTVISGFATIEDNHIVRVYDECYTTKNIIIATGAKPSCPDIAGTDLRDVLTSDELLSRREEPYDHLLIIGGGVIGLEFATIYSELGKKVTIIEYMDRIIPTFDREVALTISMSLKKRGVTIITKARVDTISDIDGLGIDYEVKGIMNHMKADGILIATGRKADTSGLFGSNFTLELDNGMIKVDSNFETSIRGIYAIGDVIRGMQLAHLASAQGIYVAETIANNKTSINLSIIPSCIYTSPEVAVVGLTKDMAKEKGIDVLIGKYPLSGNSKTLIEEGDRGYIKVIIDKESDRILGAEVVCNRATDMIGELAMAIGLGLLSKDVASIIRPHPTYEEGISEALEDVYGMAIHLVKN